MNEILFSVKRHYRSYMKLSNDDVILLALSKISFWFEKYAPTAWLNIDAATSDHYLPKDVTGGAQLSFMPYLNPEI